MRIGIFGGTFDPPHIGHLILAQEAQEQLSLNMVLWVLTPVPPHKVSQKISALDDRIAMVTLAIDDDPKFSLSRVDINRKPPHYAVDTVALLRKESPRDYFYYLMGADSLNDLPDWYEPRQLISNCDGIGVMVRHGESITTTQIEQVIPGLAEKLYLLNTPCVEISGREIRLRVATGRPVRYFLPEKIYQYILEHKLYQV